MKTPGCESAPDLQFLSATDTEIYEQTRQYVVNKSRKVSCLMRQCLIDPNLGYHFLPNATSKPIDRTIAEMARAMTNVSLPSSSSFPVSSDEIPTAGTHLA